MKFIVTWKLILVSVASPCATVDAQTTIYKSNGPGVDRGSTVALVTVVGRQVLEAAKSRLCRLWCGE
jgi:hypothetical protein